MNSAVHTCRHVGSVITWVWVTHTVCWWQPTGVSPTLSLPSPLILPSFRPTSLTSLSTWMKRLWRNCTGSWYRSAVLVGAWRTGISCALGAVPAAWGTRCSHYLIWLPGCTTRIGRSSTAPFKLMRFYHNSNPAYHIYILVLFFMYFPLMTHCNSPFFQSVLHLFVLPNLLCLLLCICAYVYSGGKSLCKLQELALQTSNRLQMVQACTMNQC